MPAPADLVFQQTTGTGTGNLTLSTVAGKRTFASAFGTGNTNTFDYFISSKAAVEWEIGVGYIDTTTGDLVRNTVSLSSNSNTAVNFGAGTKDIVNDIKASDQCRGAGTVTNNHAVLFDGTSGSLIKSAGFGLGSIASQAANNVSITGGSISGITDLAIADGGTNASTQADAISNVGGALVKSLYDLTGTVVSGDVLYGSAANTLARLAKATNGNVLKLASGLPAWDVPFTVQITPFTNSGTYTKATGLVAALVICTGGGGGGGGVASYGTNNKTCAAGGGGAGATAIRFLNGSEITTSTVSVTIGAGGAAGTGTNATTGTPAGNGGNGITSSFGSLLSAGGGNGGGLAGNLNSNFVFIGAGGAGGTASTGTILLTGATGGSGSGSFSGNQNQASGLSGYGGSSFWGGGGSARSVRFRDTVITALFVTGQAGQGYGSGGSGAVYSGNIAAGTTGGVGASGFCAVLEFIAA